MVNRNKINTIIEDNIDIFLGENNFYYTFYKIVNKINNKIYYGVHKTKKLYDGYAGSGRYIREKQNEIGIENFEKYILKCFQNSKEMYDYERSIVTRDLVLDENFYNAHIGGEGGFDCTIGRISVKDSNNNCMMIWKDDPRYLSGELVSNMKDLVHVKDKNGNSLTISKKQYHNNKDKYTSLMTGKVAVIEKSTGIKKHVSIDEYEKNKDKYDGVTKGTTTFRNKNGEYINCKVDDPRVKSGELVGSTKNFTIYKYKNDFSKHEFTTKDDPRVKSGELVGINYGINYYINPNTGELLTTTKDDPRVKSGEFVCKMHYTRKLKKLNKI